MMYESKFNLGDFVYIVTDEDQKKRQITGIDIRPNGVTYHCYCGTQGSEHYDFELSTEPDVVLKTSD